MRDSLSLPISTARFANVAFSDGSLLHGFNQRFTKRQPISAPHDVQRYFVTPQESGELCLMSGILGDSRDIFFPKLSANLDLVRFSDIAGRFLDSLGYEPFECDSEDEARARVNELLKRGQWPVYFFASDTTGEKDFEEFFTSAEDLDMHRFDTIGVIKNFPEFDETKLDHFVQRINELRESLAWEKSEIVDLFNYMLPDFQHKETGKYLDGRM